MIAAHNRTFAWSLAASSLLHASVLLGALPGLWKPWQAGGNTVLEARLAPQKNEPRAGAAPEAPRERAPEPVIAPPVADPAPPQPEPAVLEPPPPPPLVQPDAEPVIQKEDLPLARARETLPEQASEAPPPAEPLPAPRAVLQAGAPEYPPEALAGRIVGCVLAEIYVDDLGRVERVEIAASTQPGIFDESVRKAYGENFYMPAEKEGRRVRSRILGVASFELEGLPSLLCEQHFVDLAREINARPYP